MNNSGKFKKISSTSCYCIIAPSGIQLHWKIEELQNVDYYDSVQKYLNEKYVLSTEQVYS